MGVGKWIFPNRGDINNGNGRRGCMRYMMRRVVIELSTYNMEEAVGKAIDDVEREWMDEHEDDESMLIDSTEAILTEWKCRDKHGKKAYLFTFDVYVTSTER